MRREYFESYLGQLKALAAGLPNAAMECVGPEASACGSLMRGLIFLAVLVTANQSVFADPALLKTHCGKCHKDVEPKGDFSLRSLGDSPNKENLDLWTDSLDFVTAGEMPPPEKSRLSTTDRQRLIEFLSEKIRDYDKFSGRSKRIAPRRLNNRELANSVSDVLMIEDVGTHQPTANLLGDTLHDGFDTNGDALGISEFHLEQYIDAFRKIVDATIFSTERPATRRYEVSAGDDENDELRTVEEA